jgi:hypothetical protein
VGGRVEAASLAALQPTTLAICALLGLLPGIPELDVPSIEPLTLPEVLVAQGAGIKAVGKNIIINGPGSFIIKKLK